MRQPSGTRKPPKAAIFLTWLPLAAMWLLMAVEQPGIAAVVARMDEATRQLAAFGITFSMALFIEGPVIQLLAAGTAVSDSRENYRRLMNLMHALGWAATAVHGILCVPAVFRAFVLGVMGVPEELVGPAYLSFVMMLPWTLAVGYRRLWQGVLIRYGRTGVVPVTMLGRIVVSFAVLALGLSTGFLPGAALGGLALSLGVIAGAVLSGVFVRPVVRSLPDAGSGAPGNAPAVMSRRAMLRFYIPLALTNFINLGARPLVQMGLARGVLPLESLALWPVTYGYLFLFTSLSLSFQEVVIARLGDDDARRRLVRFGIVLSASLTAAYLAVMATPLWDVWFTGVSGLSGRLLELAPSAVGAALPVAALSALISLYRGALVGGKRTGEVTAGVAVNTVVLLLSLFAGVLWLPLPSIVVASLAYSLGFLAETIFLASRRPLAAFRPCRPGADPV